MEKFTEGPICRLLAINRLVARFSGLVEVVQLLGAGS